MIKIGDFAQLTQTSIRSLRHYDQLALFQPAHVNLETGHRYYSLEQLPRLHRIKALQNLGLSLKEIGHLLEANLTAETIRGMLLLKQAETRQMLEDAELRLSQVEMYLCLIEREGHMPNLDVVVKSINPLPIASLRRPLIDGNEIPDIFMELHSALQTAGIPHHESIGIFHPEALPKQHIYGKRPYHVAEDGMVCAFRLDDDLSHLKHQYPFEVQLLPAVKQVASVVHQGSYYMRGAGSLALYNWAEENNYWFDYPIREIYLRVVDDDLEHPQNLVEIQFPIVAQ